MSRKTPLAVALFFASVAAALAAPPRWLTLQQQLAQDRVVPGSALERLIQANQDFRLLRREEAKDGLGIPFWLRVLWHKSHPELKGSGDDPTGGYPRVLREVHAWMLAHQDLLPGPPEQTVLPAPNRTAVGTNLRISGAQAAPRSESDIRIDSWHPQRIIAASNNILTSGQQGQYWSNDGGTNWGQTLLPLVTGDSHHSDPTVDWDSNGNAWATTLGVVVDGNSNVIALRLRTYKSTSGGQTWTFDSLASGSQTAVDKQMVWVDHSATSPYHDTLYAIWHNGQPAVMNRKLPGGNWDIPIQVSGAETTGTAIGGDVTTNVYGDVFGFWPDTGTGKLLVTKSTDGGASYPTRVTIATTYGSYEIAVPAFAQRKALIYVSAGAWRTVAKNMVYAAWTDLSGEPGCTTAAQAPGANVSSPCKTRIWFSRSTNGGTTWSTPVKINNQSQSCSTPNDQFNQRMVVDEANGTLGIIYYDTVSDPGRKKADLWYQVSADDGATWYPPVNLATAQTDETVAGADPDNQYGDYNGLSASARVLFPSWTDRRNNAREEIWTARMDEQGTAYHSALNPPAMGNPLCGRLQVFACDMDRNVASPFLGNSYIVGFNAETTIQNPEYPESPNRVFVAAFGPAGNLSWSRTYEVGDARVVAVDSQGAVVVATTAGILRLSAMGNLLASYPISGWIPEKIALDPSDNVYVTGYDVMTRQAYTVRLDKAAGGDLTLSPGWPQRFGLASPVSGLSEGRAIVVKGSAVYVAGTVITSSSIWQDAMILKYPLTGGAPAAQFFYDGSVEYQSEDALNDLVVDSGGNVFATGYASGIYESAGSDFDYLTLRLNGNSFGTAAWTTRFDAGRLIAGRIVYLSTDKATSLALDPMGPSVFVTGSSKLNGNTDIRTLKYSAANGATMSDWRFDSTTNDVPSGLFVSSAGQVFVGGVSGNRFPVLAQSGDLLSALYGTPSYIATTAMSGGFSGTPPTVACLAGRNTSGAPALFIGGFYRNDCLCDPIAATGIQWVDP